LSAGPCHTGIQISRHLRIGRFGHDLLHQPLHVGDLRRVALPREQIGRDREIAELREAPAQIPNVLVQAEDLVHDQQHRQLALWFGARGPAVGIVTAAASSPWALVASAVSAMGKVASAKPRCISKRRDGSMGVLVAIRAVRSTFSLTGRNCLKV
jgi:hypothetical protein